MLHMAIKAAIVRCDGSSLQYALRALRQEIESFRQNLLYWQPGSPVAAWEAVSHAEQDQHKREAERVEHCNLEYLLSKQEGNQP